MKKIFISLAISITSLFAVGNGIVKGTVFVDSNSNGLFDAGERGIKGIQVSNGDIITSTDSRGNFSIAISDSAQSVFPILPNGYMFSKRGAQNCNFAFATPGSSVLFPLTVCDSKSSFRLAAIGDVQVENKDELSYAARTIFSELATRNDIDFSIYLGDLVNDNTSLLEAVGTQIAAVGKTAWTLSGNHDRDKANGSKTTTFNNIYGADTYAFNYGKAHFIVFNDVYTIGKRNYEGRLTPRQMRFLSRYTNSLPKDELLVICQHIPMYEVANKDSVFDIVGSRPTLILSGHAHAVSRHILRKNICELVAGATCGTFWLGERDYNAIPLSIQRYGSPRCYFTVDIKADGTYALTFKGVGEDASHCMDIWLKGEEALDNDIPSLSAQPDGTIIATVFGGCKSTEVYMSIDGGEPVRMTHIKGTAPAIQRLAYLNKEGKYPTRYAQRIPIRHAYSPFLWSATLPISVNAGAHTITITAHDDYGFSATTTRILQVP